MKLQAALSKLLYSATDPDAIVVRAEFISAQERMTQYGLLLKGGQTSWLIHRSFMREEEFGCVHEFDRLRAVKLTSDTPAGFHRLQNELGY